MASSKCGPIFLRLGTVYVHCHAILCWPCDFISARPLVTSYRRDPVTSYRRTLWRHICATLLFRPLFQKIWITMKLSKIIFGHLSFLVFKTRSLEFRIDAHQNKSRSKYFGSFRLVRIGHLWHSWEHFNEHVNYTHYLPLHFNAHVYYCHY